MKFFVFLAGLLAATALHASPVYDNATTDIGDTALYSTGPYTAIGDQIHLGGTQRVGTTASTQFYNAGTSGGSFAATLNLYAVGSSPASPVGSLLGSFITVGNSINAGDVLNVDWALGGLILPDDLVFTVTIGAIRGNVDLGLTVFDPPTVGSSSNQYFIVGSGGVFSQGSQLNGHDNIFFRLDATVPEPATTGMVALSLLTMVGLRSRRKAPQLV